MDSLMLRRRAINLNLNAYINFADPVVAEMCINAWGDGTGLTRRAAMFITNSQFGTTFKDNAEIVTFNELKFFVGLTAIPSGAFENCSNLSSVILPSSIRGIGGWAFNNCTSLSRINLGSNVLNVGSASFLKCESLAIELDIPNQNSFLAYQSFSYSGITKIKSLGKINTLGYYDNFSHCTSLSEVILPATLTTMGRSHFDGCINLRTVKILAATPPSVTSQNFRDCGDAKIYVPYSEDHSILQAYQNEWGQNANANTYDVPRLAELDENGNIPE